MFCVECGKEEEIFKDGVCIRCYLKRASFTKGPEILDIYTCSTCSSYKYKNTWLSESFEETLKRHIKDAFQISRELKKIQIKTECDEKGKNIACTVEISGFLEENKVTERHDITVRLKRTICDVCSKQFGGYYEATLQVRAEKRKLIKNELGAIRLTVENVVEILRAKGNRGLFITDMAEERGGIDFYLSEKGSAYTIAKKIQEQYGGEIKQSSTNMGMKDSRQIYRMTYLVRLPAYRKGDFISYASSFYFISSINKNKVHVLDILNWSERVFDGKDLQKARILGGFELVKEMILVSQSKDEVQVMDPKNYKTYDVRKPRSTSFDYKTISVVKLEDQIFLLPEKKHN
jgi:nonsense-mediated mRNA decay protein 3